MYTCFMARSGAAKLSDQLRAAIDGSGLSRYAICKAIELDQAVLSRFMAGTSGLSLETIDRLAALLGLQLVARKRLSQGRYGNYGKRD
jgi:hypothetical protein